MIVYVITNPNMSFSLYLLHLWKPKYKRIGIIDAYFARKGTDND